MDYKNLVDSLAALSDPVRAQHALGFFKTGKGQYGEGDRFIGVTMPKLRAVCRDFRRIGIEDLQRLLDSEIHEHRMAAVVIMSDIFKKSDESKRKKLFELYIKNTENGNINNWDIIDVSAKNVVGHYLLNKPKDILYQFARSNNIWKKRVAILSTPAFIEKGDATHTIAIAKILLHDKHDLIQKAVGWMMREVGKRIDQKMLLSFLDDHAHEMPRTMLRYSLEHLGPGQRNKYMNKQKAGK